MADANWKPMLEAISPKQERLAREFSAEIAGLRGRAPRLPDPVRLLEMAQALYEAERDDTVIGAQERPAEKSVAFQYRAELVAKEMAPVHKAFADASTAQPACGPLATIDARFDPKNGGAWVPQEMWDALKAELQQPAGDPACPVVAYLHDVIHVASSGPDQALSFAPDSFPLMGMFKSTCARELVLQADHLAAMAVERAKNADALAQWTAIMNAVIDELPAGIWADNHAAEHPCGNPLPVAVRAALAAKDARIAEIEAQLCECQVGWETGTRAIARNAELEADAKRLRTDLRVAAQTLRRYESLHLSKGTQDSLEKARVNAELASRFEHTLAAMKEKT